jgi:hypothetical protein
MSTAETPRAGLADPRHEHDGDHVPPTGSDERWQETVLLSWADPVARAGGYHHVDVQRVRGRACVQTFLVVDGAVAAHVQDLDLPLPSGDLRELRVATLELDVVQPLTGYEARVDLGRATAALEYRAWSDAHFHDMGGDGSHMAAGHFESVGRVTGSVTVDGRTTEVDGGAFHDRSWGPRDFSQIKSQRWAWASFGDDLHVCVFAVDVDLARREFGYVYDRGVRHAIARARFDTRVDEDGYSPLGATLDLWTAGGRGYRMTAEVLASSPSTQDGGYFATDGIAVWTMGGRAGPGLLSLKERSAPAPEHRRLLGLEAG